MYPEKRKYRMRQLKIYKIPNFSIKVIIMSTKRIASPPPSTKTTTITAEVIPESCRRKKRMKEAYM